MSHLLPMQPPDHGSAVFFLILHSVIWRSHSFLNELATSRQRDFVGDWDTSPRILEFFCAQLLQPLAPLGGCLPVKEDWWGWLDTSVLLHTSIGCSMIVQSVQSQHFNHLCCGDSRPGCQRLQKLGRSLQPLAPLGGCLPVVEDWWGRRTPVHFYHLCYGDSW